MSEGFSTKIVEKLDKKSNNGWTYWFAKRGNDFVSIDTIRKQYIQEHYTDKDEEIQSLFD